MSMMADSAVEDVDFANLVPLQDGVVKYVLEWTSGGALDGQQEMLAYVVMKRAGGLLAAVPLGVIPDEALEGGQVATTGLIGPSVALTVPGVLVEEGIESPIGSDLQVLVVDLDSSVSQQLFRIAEESKLLAAGFSDEDPFATRDLGALLGMARS